jgi:hypothetical protein
MNLFLIEGQRLRVKLSISLGIFTAIYTRVEENTELCKNLCDLRYRRLYAYALMQPDNGW